MAVYHKKRRLALIIPVLAVIMISALSIAYAMYGDVINNTNDTDSQYIVITPQGAKAYSQAFSKTLQFDTENRGGTVTYTLTPGQTTEITVATVDHDVVLLGELLLNIAQTGGSDDYTLTFVDSSGTMTGTFYTAISTSEDNDTYSSWTYSAYTIGTGSSYDVDNEIEWIKLRLYLDGSFQTPGGSLATTPLQSVAFTITATVD